MEVDVGPATDRISYAEKPVGAFLLEVVLVVSSGVVRPRSWSGMPTMNATIVASGSSVKGLDSRIRAPAPAGLGMHLHCNFAPRRSSTVAMSPRVSVDRQPFSKYIFAAAVWTRLPVM